MRRVTISIPEAQAAAIEEIRRRKGISRSRVVQEAIAFTLAQQEKDRAVRRYAEGYRKRPETTEALAYTKATAATMSKERWT